MAVFNATQRHVLLLTNSEYGQANTFIAFAHALAVQPNVHVHFASFVDASSRVGQLFESLKQSGTLGSNSMITFHNIGGRSMKDTSTYLQDGTVIHPPGFRGAIYSYRIMADVILGWTAEEYISGVKGCIRIIEDVDPQVIVVDNLLNQGYDACEKLGREYVASGPFSLKDISLDKQPNFITNYPAGSSGYPFPVPWSKVLPNIALTLYSIYTIFTSPHIKSLHAARKAFGLKGTIPLFRGFRPNVEYIAAMIPELDFHLPNLPANITMCGPFVLPVTDTVVAADTELASWLQNGGGRTILINLGTHALSDNFMAKEIAQAIGSVIQHERNQGRYLQVLWKLKVVEGSSVETTVNEELGKEIGAGRVRVINWLKVDPLAILQEGSVICSVHHGGANSFFESVITGTPQIILPRWYDLYDYAQRVEYLGIGIYASKNAAPGVEAAAFATALIDIITPDNKYLPKAKALANICEEKCGGREMAARRLLELADLALKDR
ncbi:hypothetical protein BDQ12DRAFT_738513 [Crucibulum laeve]|uniref:Erythromycin biosynthesis protein CIII-like C-terminal domain-containing protein n=1 Tax=Crucibulum laeve TaxID=68775 RepID=A0A5C3LLF0_9AGAR|nr:hypothetical protein BDQ12DRAFT_738513 [Crucibulum laeve]